MKSQQRSGDNIRQNKLLVIVGGPTCSGKTSLAIDIARSFKTEIVSADSRQFYAEMNIGTAKPSPDELRQVKHHFIGSHSVKHHLNASDYAESAMVLLKTLFEKFGVVIMAGGSGQYIDTLIFGIDDLPPANEKIRQHLKTIQDESGVKGLSDLLKIKDPESYQTIDIQNPRRVIRALEVTLDTGEKYSSLLGKKSSAFPWKWMMTGISLERDVLYQRIHSRTTDMICNGLKEEVASLVAYRHSKALQTVGYREMFEHLDGITTLEQAEQKISQNTRNYAKRQLTWFRKYRDMFWIQPGETELLLSRIRQELNSDQ